MTLETADAALLKEKEAARVLGVHPRTLRRWREDRRVAFLRTPTGAVRFRLEDLLELTRFERVPPNVRD